MAEMREPPYVRHVLTSPLHLEIAAESRTNQWISWNGVTTPSVLTSLEDEERAVRDTASMGDISPLHKYRIAGPDALRYLSRLVTGQVGTLEIDEIQPVLFCEDRGFVVGDGSLWRCGESEYYLVTEENHLAWLLDSAIGMDVQIEDLTLSLAGILLQGPFASEILSLAGIESEELAPLRGRRVIMMKAPVYVSRMGRFGAAGYELWMDAADAPSIWALLLEKGTTFGLRATGYSVRELARVEAGILKSGTDYLGAFSSIRLESASTPLDLGMMALVDMERGHFTGRQALETAIHSGPRHAVAPMQVDWPTPLFFNSLYESENPLGVVTSRVFSPGLGRHYAFARVKSDRIANDRLHIVAEVKQEFSLERITVPARIITKFFDPHSCIDSRRNLFRPS